MSQGIRFLVGYILRVVFYEKVCKCWLKETNTSVLKRISESGMGIYQGTHTDLTLSEKIGNHGSNTVAREIY